MRTVSSTSESEFTKFLTLAKTIRPDCESTISPLAKFFPKVMKSDYPNEDFDNVIAYLEKCLAYESGPINIGVIMRWVRAFVAAKMKNWNAGEAKDYMNGKD